MQEEKIGDDLASKMGFLEKGVKDEEKKNWEDDPNKQVEGDAEKKAELDKKLQMILEKYDDSLTDQ